MENKNHFAIGGLRVSGEWLAAPPTQATSLETPPAATVGDAAHPAPENEKVNFAEGLKTPEEGSGGFEKGRVIPFVY